ncbi:MAG: hypothetical protein ABFS86_09220 [Planctomycetota bacterium]
MSTTRSALIALCVFSLFTTALVAKGKKKKEGPVRHESRWAKKLDADPEVKELEKDEAKKLLAALSKAVKTKDANKIIAAAEPMITKSHETFFKDLAKLAKHRSGNVRIVATKALGSQKEPAKKIGSTLTGLLMYKPNKSYGPALGMIIDSLRRQKFTRKPTVDEIEGIFKKQTHPKAMRAAARYFGDNLMLDRVKLLVQWVEAPQPASVNSPSNPPASYWKRMWEIWNEMKETVWYSLETMTGKDFKTKREWEQWCRSPEAKRMGVD